MKPIQQHAEVQWCFWSDFRSQSKTWKPSHLGADWGHLGVAKWTWLAPILDLARTHSGPGSAQVGPARPSTTYRFECMTGMPGIPMNKIAFGEGQNPCANKWMGVRFSTIPYENILGLDPINEQLLNNDACNETMHKSLMNYA